MGLEFFRRFSLQYRQSSPHLREGALLLMMWRIYKVLWFVNQKAQYGVIMSSYIVCLVTIDDFEKAASIARTLVEKKLVACVNILPQIRSVYTWKGKICDEPEQLMIMKSRQDLFSDLQAEIKALHPYELPEIIALKIDKGLPDYLNWINENTTPPI